MDQLIIAIALLCQLSTGAENGVTIEKVQSLQQKCQKELSNCVLTVNGIANNPTKLLKCVKDRQI